jgi:hypothetical protein
MKTKIPPLPVSRESSVMSPIEPFANGYAVLFVNGVRYGLVTQDEFMDLCDEEADEAAPAGFRFASPTVGQSGDVGVGCAAGDEVAFERKLDQFISSSEVARLLGLRTATLRKYRGRGKGPLGYIATGKTRGVYPVEAVIAYQEELRQKGRV